MKLMITAPRRHHETARTLAASLGMTAIEAHQPLGESKAGLRGAAGTSARLRALGARWDARNRALVFASWTQLEAALLQLAGGGSGNGAGKVSAPSPSVGPVGH